MKRQRRVADSLKAAAAMVGVDIGTVRSAKAAGCPAFRGGRVHLSELSAWLAEVRRRKHAPPTGAPKAGGVIAQTGLEASLARLADEEFRAYGALQDAKARNDLLAIPGDLSRWLQCSEALRKADTSLESARREAGELVPREVVEKTVGAALHGYAVGLRPVLLGACARLYLPGSQANELTDALTSVLPLAVASANAWIDAPAWLKRSAEKGVEQDYGKRAPALVATYDYVLRLVAGIVDAAGHNEKVKDQFFGAIGGAYATAGLEMPEPPTLSTATDSPAVVDN